MSAPMHLLRFALPSLLLGCSAATIRFGTDSGRPDLNSDADTDADADADTDSDSDTDTDTDTDSDSDADTDTDSDADTDTDTDTDTGPVLDPTSCADVLAAHPSSASGVYAIDPDGTGPNPPFNVLCDMDTDGGGWTLWWWFNADGTVDWRSVHDVLGSNLADCDPAADSCFAHIPDPSASELRATDGTDWATWQFDAGNTTSARAYAAFVNRTTSVYQLDLHLDVWNPVRQSSVSPRFTDPFACDSDRDIASDGDCRNFWYADARGPYGTVRSFNLDDDGGYGQTAFAGGTDNSGADVGCDFFEQSLSYTDGTCTGALYYR